MQRYLLRSSTALTSLCVVLLPLYGASVQAAEERVAEEITITGSYIKRKSQLDSPSPLNVIGGSDIEAQGLNNLGDLARNMTFNSGAEVNTDAFTQNFSTGTANINLRGLGLNSTLVLVNGRRQTLSGAYADDGTTFVDTNSLMPLIMVDRVETLKDGAAALYGTDAVAGVVNFITRDNFEGVELQADYQTTTADSQEDMSVSGIFGAANDRGNIVLSFSYLRRTPLSAGDREFTDGTGVSASGQPGSFIGLLPDPTLPVPDPFCEQATNSFVNVLAQVGPTVIGTCNFQFDSYYDLVPRERRLQTYATANYDLADSINAFAEIGYTRNRADRNNAPSFPIAVPVPVSAAHPGNPFGQDVGFIGRLLGGTAGPSPSTHDSDTLRMVGGLEGDFGSNWSWQAAVTYSRNEFTLTVEDIKTDRYLAALAGVGGPNNDQYFNPFGTSLSATPDQVGIYNDPAVIRDIIGIASSDAETNLTTFDAHVTGDLFNMPAGPVGIAIGGQFRHEKMAYDWDANYNAENYLFLLGGPDFAASRDVGAVFAELAIPLLETLELQLAARYEDYGSGINSFDPKAALLWRPNNRLAFRASAGTSFQAPSLFQTNGSLTSLSNIRVGGRDIFRAVRTDGNALVPQSADVYNVGVTIEPVDGLSASLDYWRFEYSNLITREDAQGIVDAALMGSPAALAKIDFTMTGDIRLVRAAFINAPTVTTDGIDVTASYTWDYGASGMFRLGGEATYVNKYKAIDQNGDAFDGAGSRNFGTFARSIPEWRGNVNFSWSWGGHGFNAFVRYIDSYANNENDTTVGSHTTLDLQYTLSFEEVFNGSTGTALTIGAINVLNNDIPELDTFGGFDSKVHDPRGRLVYVSLKQGF